VASPFSLLSGEDLKRLVAGAHTRLYAKLGAQPVRLPGVEGVYFAVWAPRASGVSVVAG